MMRAAAIALVAAGGVAAGCGESVNDDLVPSSLQGQLVFAERTIQLQPDDSAPTFTMKVPTIWAQDRALVAPVDAHLVLVNGAGERDPSGYLGHTEWGDPELRDGHFDLAVTCGDSCGDAFVQKMFASWRGGNHVVDETGTDRDRTLVLVNDEDRHFAIRAWRVDGDTRYRVCWVSIGKRWSKAYRAFVKACADAVEHDR